MENITSTTIKAFLKENKPELASSHKRLCLPIINRIYRKMLAGDTFNDIKVCEGLIIDGHHRYVSALIAGIKLGVAPSYKSSATQQYNWEDIEFVHDDWDTNSNIRIK